MMTVTWSTRNASKAICRYGLDNLDQESSEGMSQEFIQGDNVQYIHKVKLSNLKPGRRYGE